MQLLLQVLQKLMMASFLQTENLKKQMMQFIIAFSERIPLSSFHSHGFFFFSFYKYTCRVWLLSVISTTYNKHKSVAPSSADGHLKFRGLSAVYGFVLFCCIKQLSTETLLLNSYLQVLMQLFSFSPLLIFFFLKGYRLSLKNILVND